MNIVKFSRIILLPAINEGKGNFSIQELPSYVQFSSVNAILCSDIDEDGKTDIILGGKNFDFLPQLSKLDASLGHVLLNNGSANFKLISNDLSGLDLRGAIRDSKRIPSKGTYYFLFLQNNDMPVFFQINKGIKNR